MSKAFREYHLLNALNSFDFATLPLDVFLSKYFRLHKSIGSKDRKFISEQIYLMIRWLGLLDYLCLHPISWKNRYETLKKISLKKTLSDESIPAHIRLSFPENFYQLLIKYYGNKAFNLCLQCNETAPTTIRVNILKTTRQSLLTKWQKKFLVIPTKISPWGITFSERMNFCALEEFKEGLFEIQDEASQLIADLLEAVPGDKILDFCAGSGGKTLAFAHKLQGRGQIFLHDIRNSPLIKAKRRLRRAGIENAQILSYDSIVKKELKGKMDWIFLDVPCSGSGTLRRNPDLKWKFSKQILEQLIEEQRKIFDDALPFLKPGGKIIYSTCSIFPPENEEQILFFQEKYQVTLLHKPFVSFPTTNGMDGFFGAILRQS